MELYISAQGLVRMLYGEAIPVRSLGAVQIQRASHLDPDESGNWWADLGPSGGPILGPFHSRSAALDAEQEWLTRHVLDPTRVLSAESPTPLHDPLPRPDSPTISSAPTETAFQTSVGHPDLS